MAMRHWVRVPSMWIEDGGLKELQWTNAKGSGSDNIAALMALAPIAHNADQDGLAKCTYDQLSLATGLSRAKVSAGLSVLAALGLIEREPSGRSTFQLANYQVAGGWSKLPARRMYGSGRIIAFEHFHLRTMTELHALKLYYLFARRRAGKKAAHRVPLPAGGLHHRGNRCARGRLQHRDDTRLLRASVGLLGLGISGVLRRVCRSHRRWGRLSGSLLCGFGH